LYYNCIFKKCSILFSCLLWFCAKNFKLGKRGVTVTIQTPFLVTILSTSEGERQHGGLPQRGGRSHDGKLGSQQGGRSLCTLPAIAPVIATKNTTNFKYIFNVVSIITKLGWKIKARWISYCECMLKQCSYL